MSKTKTIFKTCPKINNRLRYYRKLKGYTQRDVAKILIVNQSDISNWEQGLKYPGTKNLLKLSIAFSRFPNSLYEDLYWDLTYEIRKRETKLGYAKL